jgi:hypothetical protein
MVIIHDEMTRQRTFRGQGPVKNGLRLNSLKSPCKNGDLKGPAFSPLLNRAKGGLDASGLYQFMTKVSAEYFSGVPENAGTAKILVPAAVGDGFGGMAPLVAVGDFEEFIGPGGGFVVTT